MSVFDDPKIDCHCHLLNPSRFPYAADAPYRPEGAEIATAEQMNHVFAAYGIGHAVIVQPNSGYSEDNSCLLSALDAGAGRFKGVAVVAPDISLERLAAMKARHIVGIAFNLPLYGPRPYLETRRLLEMLTELDMFLQIQVRDDQLLTLTPLIEASPVRLLFDHCGRPAIDKGLEQSGFQKLLSYGRSGRGAVKLSGFSKFSAQAHPYEDARPYVEALLEAFTPSNCLWGSDWPFLRAPARIDYGPLLKLAETQIPDASARRQIFWDTPMRLFRFGDQS